MSLNRRGCLTASMTRSASWPVSKNGTRIPLSPSTTSRTGDVSEPTNTQPQLSALSCGCVFVGSDTSPVREVVDGDNGILVPFFDTGQLADRVIEAVRHPRRFNDMRVRARQLVLDRFDGERLCVPKTLELVRGLR